MLRPTLVAALLLALPAIAIAQGTQAPINLLPPAGPREAVPPVSTADKQLLDEPSPSFQPLRPADPETPPPAVIQTLPSQPAVAPPPPPPPPPRAAEILPSPPTPEAAPAPAPTGLPTWALGVLVLFGAFLAAMFGILTALMMRRAEATARRRSVAATLATELDTRRQAYEAVPLPPNVEAGVSFVSSVTSLAGIEAGFRSVQGNLHLLPEKLAAHVSVHYAAVQRVSDFVKGQSMAAAVRMLQANRLGGHPCPDAGAMREAHVELGAAFRGVDKLVQMLRGLR